MLHFAEADDTTTDIDSTGKTTTADTGATAQLPGVAQATPCHPTDVSSRKIDTTNPMKSDNHTD